MYRSLFSCAFIFGVLVAQASQAAEPKGVALDAIDALFVERDPASFQKFLAAGAVQGDREPGSALEKLQKQSPANFETVELDQVIFFRASDIDRLSASYPDDLWRRVQKHIRDQQGVLVKLELKGEAAERARAVGKDPRDVAMMTFVVDDAPDPKVIHIDDN